MAKGGCEVDEREELIRTLLVELGGQILVLFFSEESEGILAGGVRAFFFRKYPSIISIVSSC